MHDVNDITLGSPNLPELWSVEQLVADNQLDVVVVGQGRLERLHSVDGGRRPVGNAESGGGHRRGWDWGGGGGGGGGDTAGLCGCLLSL